MEGLTCHELLLLETEKIFAAATDNKLETRAHVGQLSFTSLRALLNFGPATFDHLDHITDEDLTQLATSDTIATLVPGANHFLGLRTFPNARQFIAAGAAVALATDYNPGSSPTTSIPFVLSLACTHMKMTPAEAITATTINAAYSLNRGHEIGSLEPGKMANVVIHACHDYRELAYFFGIQHASSVFCEGIDPIGRI